MPQATNPSFLQSFLEYEFGWFHLPENIKSCSQPTYMQRSAIQFSFISLPIAFNTFSETSELEILQGRDPIGHTQVIPIIASLARLNGINKSYSSLSLS